MSIAGKAWHAARARRKGGVTLVEVMLAMVVLALIAVGGSAFMYQSRATIAEQGRKRIAHEMANARLEEIRAIPWPDFTNRVHDLTGVQPFSRGSGGVLELGGPAREQVVRNGFPFKLETRISRLDDFLFDIEVTAIYAVRPEDENKDFVKLRTHYLPEIDFF